MKTIALALAALLIGPGMGRAGSVLLKSMNGGDTGMVTVNGDSEYVYINQFNVTYTSAFGQRMNFGTFCIDLTHNVSVGQTYAVFTGSSASLHSTFSNGARMSQVFDFVNGSVAINPGKSYTVGGHAYNGNDYAAGIQLALWELSLNAHNPTGFTKSGGVWSSGDPGVFHVSGINDSVGALTDYLLGHTFPGGGDVGWLNADANGFGQNRGQSLLVPLDDGPLDSPPAAAPEPSALALSGAGGVCSFCWFWLRRRGRVAGPRPGAC
jgi:hypothetical protein